MKSVVSAGPWPEIPGIFIDKTNKEWIMRFPVLLAAGITLIASVNASALNGKAVVVVNNLLAPLTGPQDANASRMVVVTTQSVGNLIDPS